MGSNSQDEKSRRPYKYDSIDGRDKTAKWRLDVTSALYWKPKIIDTKEIEAAFKVFDTDGSGSLSLDEFKAILQAPGGGKSHHHPPRDSTRARHAAGAPSLTWRRRLPARGRQGAQALSDQQVADLFKKIDADWQVGRFARLAGGTARQHGLRGGRLPLPGGSPRTGGAMTPRSSL